jgi:hypothetical protein
LWDIANKMKTSRIVCLILLFLMVTGMEMFGWYHIRDYFNINHPEIVEAGHSVEKLTKDKSLVIAPYGGDTAFLYQTNRAGWPIIEDSMDKLIKKGAQYYVSVNFDDITKKLMTEALIQDPDKRIFKILELTDKFVIIQLVPDNQLQK